MEADKLRGEWTDPRLSKTTVAEWSERWLRTKTHLKPKTLAGYESNLRVHVLPIFGSYQLRHVDRMSVEEWVADLQASGLGPSGVFQARQVVNSTMKLAVEAGYLVANPVSGVKVAPQPISEMLFLSAEEVERLASAIRDPYATLVYLLAYGGLRWGEAVAIRRKRCQLLSVPDRGGRVALRGQGYAALRLHQDPPPPDGGDPGIPSRTHGRAPPQTRRRRS